MLQSSVQYLKEAPMKKSSCLAIAALALMIAPFQARAEGAVTTNNTSAPTAPVAPPVTTPSSTTVVVPPGTAVVVPPAPAPAPTVVEVPKVQLPRDAITGEPVAPKPPVEKEESIRDKVREKMQH